jgi:hypothetical protein
MGRPLFDDQLLGKSVTVHARRRAYFFLPFTEQAHTSKFYTDCCFGMESTAQRVTASCILPGQWLKRPLPDKQCRHHKRSEYGRGKVEVNEKTLLLCYRTKD